MRTFGAVAVAATAGGVVLMSAGSAQAARGEHLVIHVTHDTSSIYWHQSPLDNFPDLMAINTSMTASGCLPGRFYNVQVQVQQGSATYGDLSTALGAGETQCSPTGGLSYVNEVGDFADRIHPGKVRITYTVVQEFGYGLVVGQKTSQASIPG